MKKYYELKQENQERVDAFPFMFAFSNQQFEEGKQKLGVKDNSELLSIGSGGYIRKTDREAYKTMMGEIETAKGEYLKDPEQLKDALIYELENHEYIYTMDLTDTMEALGLDEEELTGEQLGIISQARRQYLAESEELNS